MCFPEFFESIEQINQTSGGGHGKLRFVAKSDRSCGSPGDLLLAVAS